MVRISLGRLGYGYPSLGVRLRILEKNKQASLSHITQTAHKEIHGMPGIYKHRPICTYNYINANFRIDSM